MNKSKPDDYQPPYLAYSARPTGGRSEIVSGLVGIQVRNGASGDGLYAEAIRILTAEETGRPDHVERADFVDETGALNLLLLPYWKTAEDQQTFLERRDVLQLLQTPRRDDLGLFVECYHAPTTSMDANYSIPNVQYGIARYSELEIEQFHAYMGSMRDRVPDFLSGLADAAPSPLRRREGQAASLGNALEIMDLPHNLCFIRGAFAWKDASREEQVDYERDMLVVYKEGSEYLRDHSEDANCVTMRMADNVELDFDNGVQSNSIGWFLSLKDLENWVTHHPRHLAIMRSIMDFMKRYDFKPKLNLGHEVVVVPKGNVKAIYNNCHEETGFIPYFETRHI